MQHPKYDLSFNVWFVLFLLFSQNLKECSSNPCLNNANCIDDPLGSYKCLCLMGFTGHNCETEINECETAVCPPNSECVDDIGGFHCVCKEGLTGKFDLI